MYKPNEVKMRAQKYEEQNYEFRLFLKNFADSDELDARFLALHNELFAAYNCCDCTNCCKTYRITLSADEVKRIAAFIGLTESELIARYLSCAASYDEKPYSIREKPCSFLLDDGRCKIQDCKPDVCAGFPYTDHPERLSGLYSMIENAKVCPVVFEILERLKVIYRFQSRR